MISLCYNFTLVKFIRLTKDITARLDNKPIKCRSKL